MFLTSTSAWIIIVAEFLFGCLIGLLVAAILKRSKLTFGVATRAACVAGLTLLFAIGFVGWGGSNAVIENGHTTAVGNSGEVLPFRTFVANNGYLIPGGTCILAAVTTVLLSRNRNDKSLGRFDNV
jgi:hypothetical protein